MGLITTDTNNRLVIVDHHLRPASPWAAREIVCQVRVVDTRRLVSDGGPSAYTPTRGSCW